jgi:ATP-dependent helicase/DNAse subunit B
VAGHVERVLRQKLPAHLREQMPRRYLELEGQRLIRLVCEWLEYEATRVGFVVAATEIERTVAVAGLSLKLRLDRIDQLSDGSQLVIDYKTGSVSPSDWQPPRPEDVQLPLYAGFALGDDEELGGLVFAKLRPGEMNFAGFVGDASTTLFAGLKGYNPLVKNQLSAEMLMDWRDCIEQLARDFIDGKAAVEPRDPPRTCEYCGLETLCRIQESQPLPEEDDASEEDADE